MENTETKGRLPDYKGKLDVACWINKDKNGKKYLTMQIAHRVNLFKNEPKEIKEETI